MILIHDVSQTALAGAVLTLGLVILLELRSIVRLRRLVDGHLARVFEQLDLLRYENQQLLEARTPAPAAAGGAGSVRLGRAPAAPKPAPVMPLREVSSPTPSPTPPLAAGEARLLASLAAARARRELPESSAAGSRTRG